MLTTLVPFIGTAAGAALAYAIVESAIKMYAHYRHERVWDKIKWGRELVQEQGCCIWMTGLSGAGKTTVAIALEAALKKRLKKVERLDGDIVRKTFCSDLGFSKEDRDENIRRISYVSSYLSQEAIVIASFISPYRQAREKARAINNNFIEVFVDAPLKVCEARDVKGLYAKARSGEIKNFTGIDDPYEVPRHPEIHLDTDKETVEESVQKILDYLKKRGLM